MERREEPPGAPPAQPATLYERDLAEWLGAQVAALRDGRTYALDVPNLIDELEGLAGRDRRELRSRLQVILTHMLKARYQPGRASRSWGKTIRTQLREIDLVLDDSPSLKREIPRFVDEAYARARRDASYETRLALANFPENNPFTIEEIFAQADLSETG